MQANLKRAQELVCKHKQALDTCRRNLEDLNARMAQAASSQTVQPPPEVPQLTVAMLEARTPEDAGPVDDAAAAILALLPTHLQAYSGECDDRQALCTYKRERSAQLKALFAAVRASLCCLRWFLFQCCVISAALQRAQGLCRSSAKSQRLGAATRHLPQHAATSSWQLIRRTRALSSSRSMSHLPSGLWPLPQPVWRATLQLPRVQLPRTTPHLWSSASKRHCRAESTPSMTMTCTRYVVHGSARSAGTCSFAESARVPAGTLGSV